MIESYREKDPMVQIALHTGTADTIYEMMNQGLVDIGLFMEPVRTEGLEYIRIQDSDQGVQSELASWFGKEFEQVKVAFTSNLGTNAGIMAMQGLGYPVSIEGAPRYWRTDLLIQKPLCPEITGADPQIQDYDEILIGFPIWWYVAPTIINTFLETYDFSGKKIVLFATSGGSGFGNTVKELQPSAPKAEIVAGKLLNHANKQDVENWVKTL